ncbi:MULTISPECIES: ECF transporter S component [Cytobacillus]|uniref:ECF transporter S component n=1 Tax=Cytobacillus TaxID=2675230 RepID=UPI0018CE77CD|nr:MULTISPECIES: ECF transporter S component [Cytobacillus]MBG9445005.1 riboflavin transporter FmnP [Cytobacillus firmus]MBG9448803.1 riboflavin transporter FmnP [Cytobacillus firmus]MBY6051372.1 ECF transporter S component [Cytobacillus firmus]MCC3647834.1 ECF transporter S component [Cytobacillus oceanisediminis]MCS0654068.1 ECF transporter S component [Cytobacillus firmus]
MKKLNIKSMVAIGMLSSISYVLMLLNFPIPPFPQFLMIDFSDIPALIAALIFGPAAGILVELIKNILDYFMTGSATGVPVGHIANFAAGILFVLPTYYVYSKLKTKKGMTFGLVIGTMVMAVIMSVLNYVVILPAYTFFLNFPAMSAPEMRTMIVTGILPFNILKGIIISIVFMLIFTRMRTWVEKQAVLKSAA